MLNLWKVREILILKNLNWSWQLKHSILRHPILIEIVIKLHHWRHSQNWPLVHHVCCEGLSQWHRWLKILKSILHRWRHHRRTEWWSFKLIRRWHHHILFVLMLLTLWWTLSRHFWHLWHLWKWWLHHWIHIERT